MVVERAGQRDEHGARIVRVADRAEPVGAVAGDQRDVREGFDVVDQSGPAARAGDRGEDDAVARQGRATLDALDDGGLLAGDELVRRLHQGDLVRVQPGGAPLVERFGRRRHGVGVQIQIDLVGVDGGGGGLEPVEHQMWGAFEQHGVLAAQRLTLGGVADDHRFGAIDRGHLDGGGKARTAASGQS